MESNMKKLLVLLLVLATAALTFTACVTPPADEVKTEVTLDAQGGTLESTTLTATKGAAYTLPTPTKAGYVFDGWYLGETKVESTGTWAMDDAAIALVAKWTANTTTITLEGVEGDVTATFGADYTLPTPLKTGYTFAGWYNGDTKVESTGKWAIEDATLALTAKWTAKTTVITLEGIEAPVNATYDAAYELPTATKAGYTFAGWYLGETAVALTGTWAMDDAAVALTAKWTANTTIITLVNGDDTSSIEVTYDAAYTLPALTLDGYTFDGWFDAEDNKVADAGTWTVDAATVTLTAKWTEIPPTVTTVTLNATGGALEDATVEFTVGEAYTLPVPTKTGNTFAGWYYGTAKLELTGTWEYDVQSATLIAAWTARETTVTVQNGDATETIKITYGFTYDLTTPTKVGYTFDGWYVGDDKIETAGKWAVDADTVTVVAKWNVKTTKVTLNANGGAIEGDTSATIAYGSEYTLAAPTKAGYEFVGWSTGTKTLGTTGTWDIEDAEITLTAIWGTATDDVPGDNDNPEVEDNIDAGGWT